MWYLSYVHLLAVLCLLAIKWLGWKIGDTIFYTTSPMQTKPAQPFQENADGGTDYDQLNGIAFLLETIPRDTPGLQPILGTRDTWEVQMEYIQGARHRIDFWAMYWTLLVGGDYTSEQQLRWGTYRGRLIYQELQRAAQRGVRIRIISEHRLSGIEELEALHQKYPNQVSFQLWNASEWYEFGMMHLKGWIFDTNRAMITDANTDWRSFTQVKEVGVALEAAEGEVSFLPVQDLQLYFDRWWAWTDPTYKESVLHDHNGTLRMKVFDPFLQTKRLVPCYSMVGRRDHNSNDLACKSPFFDSPSSVTVYNQANPMPLLLNNTVGNSFFSCSPPDVCDTPDASYSHQTDETLDGRTWDGDALVQTILSAHEQICISTMYFIPAALTVFLENPAWWPTLVDALLLKVSQGLRVRLLISQWTDAYKAMPGYFRAMLASAKANAEWARNKNGTLEIRYFAIPGWQNATGDEYPEYSRVSHAKYIVTDHRFNLGTNEMEWSFFFNTAGTSFNSDHPILRQQLQNIFDRDWDSEYAIPIPTE